MDHVVLVYKLDSCSKFRRSVNEFPKLTQYYYKLVWTSMKDHQFDTWCVFDRDSVQHVPISFFLKITESLVKAYVPIYGCWH